MDSGKRNMIISWFKTNYRYFVEGNRLKSWAEKNDIILNADGVLVDYDLFHLFVLAILWNNKKTRDAKKGENVFNRIKSMYTFYNFVEAAQNESLADRLRAINSEIDNPAIFNTLMFIVNGRTNQESVWARIKKILTYPKAGDREVDLNRFMKLYSIFNPKKPSHAYLKVKLFLIFREIRIQFRNTGKYQYNPTICCVPDCHIRNALRELKLVQNLGKSIYDYLKASGIVAAHFCTDTYDLYDLPLFFCHKHNKQLLKQS